MKEKRIFGFCFVLFISIFSSIQVFNQQKYWVVFTDKDSTSFNPHEYFDPKAIARRVNLNLPLYTESDLPVNQCYIDSISESGAVITTVSRWMNAVATELDEKQKITISTFPYVKEIVPMAELKTTNARRFPSLDDLDEDEEKLLLQQLTRMKGDLFIDSGIDGRGIRIAVFDAGFPGVNTAPAFAHLRKNGQIIKTWDFVKNKADVYDYMNHGTMVLSCIAGIIDGQKMGLATGAEFLLARTEVKPERFKEEEYWMAAVEWADKNGADIINSSLGYTYHRYFANQMDGKTTLVTRAANLAASKGILVINAMGNDGDKDWEVLGAPADADSVLSIGGIDPNTDYHISFSSFGPTYDKRAKPNLSAYGKAIVSTKTKLKTAYGTSFSTPLVTGFAACAKQLNPGLTNMELFRELEKSGDLYPYYDYAHGYGVPQADYFLSKKDRSEITESFQVLKADEKISVIIPQQYFEDEKDIKKYVYYNIKDSSGIIRKYAIVAPYQEEVLVFSVNDFKDNEQLTIHYDGYTKKITF